MATLISKASGAWSTAGTWALCSVAAEMDSEVGTNTIGSSTLDSLTFVLEANQIDAIAIKVVTNPTPSGTFTAILRNNTTSTNIASVTINRTDFDSNGLGWYVFPLGLNHTPNGTDNYVIRLSSTVSGTNCFTNGSNFNWTRQIRSTATQAPGSGDKLLVCGEHTGAGTGNSFTVTMDNTATTSFGPTVSGGPPQGISVGKRATLQFGTSASTAYYLKWKGILAVYGGGTLNVGTSGTRMPSTSSAVLEMDSAVNVDSGLNIFPGGTFNAYGDNARLTNTLMTADKAAAATAITLVATTGWAASDVLAFASTTRTAADCESKIILTVDSSTQVTLTAGLTNAHSGTSPTQAEVVNLTRNVKIRGVSASLQGYVVFQTTATVNADYCEFTQLGSATGGKRGIDSGTTTGTCSLTHCSIHDFAVVTAIGFNAGGSGSLNNITFSSNVMYNVNGIGFQIVATTGTWTADSNVFILSGSGQNLVTLSDVGGTFTNNTIVGATGNGLVINEGNTLGTFSGNVIHSNSGQGVSLAQNTNNGTLDTFTVWRNNTDGIRLSGNLSDLTISNLVAFGNNGNNINFAAPCGNILFTNAALNGDSTFSTTTGVNISNTGAPFPDIIFESCNFGVTNGIKTTHTNDITPSAVVYTTVTLRSCLLSSGTQVGSQTNLLPGSYVRAQKLGGTNGNHKAWTRYGNISIDTVIFDAASPSARLTPNNASFKLASDGGSKDGYGSFDVAVASGGAVTVSVRVRESVVGGGTAYNGNLPRLILRKNVSAGIAADTVLATATSASVGAWETINGTTASVTDDAVLSFVVDCDGTTGWVNVDTWTGIGQNTTDEKYWYDGAPFNVALTGPPIGRITGSRSIGTY